jgi:hypothetical protein
VDYTNGSRLDPRSGRESASSQVYSYADQMNRDESPPRGYGDDRYRHAIDPRPEKKKEMSLHVTWNISFPVKI